VRRSTRGRAAIPPHQFGPHVPLKGKGFPAKDGTGDLMATVRIVLPGPPTPSSKS